jgi:hypothetical protein
MPTSGFLLDPTFLFALSPLDDFVAVRAPRLMTMKLFSLPPLDDLDFGGTTPPLSDDEELSPAAACEAALVGTSAEWLWSRW